MNDLTSLILEDHNRLRELFRSAASDPDEHAVRSLVRALVIHERVEEEMLEAAAAGAGAEVVRHSLQVQAEHHRLLERVMQLDPSDGSPSVVGALQRAFLVHLEHEEKVLLPAIAEVAGVAGMARLGVGYEQTRADHHRDEGPFRLEDILGAATLTPTG
ncbi:MAG: hypothetical protein JWP14_2049 [Frankiales bacterium]|nr:hypothetical protein [Frankiales bacterium]